MDEKIVDALRTKYQYDMKRAVSLIDAELKNPSFNSIDSVDKYVGDFYQAKEKASYLEAIVKNLKGEE
mgnify:CR=1 FL=1|jgi:hypothetical protein